MIGLGWLWQRVVRRRLDLETAVAGTLPEAWIIMTDIGDHIDIVAAIDGRLVVHAFAKAELALDHAIGRIHAVDDHGDAGTAGNHDIEPVRGEGRGGKSDHNGQS